MRGGWRGEGELNKRKIGRVNKPVESIHLFTTIQIIFKRMHPQWIRPNKHERLLSKVHKIRAGIEPTSSDIRSRFR
jgi:hypothetical protein